MPNLPRVHKAQGGGFKKAGGNKRRGRYQTADYKRKKRLYNSKAWKETRRHHLARNPLCVECGQIAHHVDHIDGNCFNNSPKNHASMCIRCHGRKTVLQDGGFGRGRAE